MHIAPARQDDGGPGQAVLPTHRRRTRRRWGSTRTVAAAALTLIAFATAGSFRTGHPEVQIIRNQTIRNVAATFDAMAPAEGTTAAVPMTEGTTVASSGEGAPIAVQSAQAIPAAWPRGIDISSWQHPGGAQIGWAAVRSSGVTFAIVKATEGMTYTNPYFATDRTRAVQAGLVVGAYHYARPVLPIATATEQADRFLTVTGLTRSNGHIAPILDLEAHGGLSADQLTTWTRAFMEEIETKTGRTPILYTYRSFWSDTMKNTTSFSRYPLWFAIYNGGSSPGPLPGGWQKWAMWQFTSSGSLPGITGNVDMNIVCCGADALSANADGRVSEIDRRYGADPRVPPMLGAAIRNEEPAGGGGRWRQFEQGLLFWSVATDVHEVHGGISAKYLNLGGSNSFLGRPTSDEVDAEASGSRQSAFQGGRIYWSSSTDAHEIHGAILNYYLSLGAAGSDLGLPVSDEYPVEGGRQSTFQYGWLRWDADSNAVTIIRP
ncbi:GH25 family lysozyme [Protofrankia symbiont of Coriaria ruscifolia]|uniref:GH25 family lysozyme n=1 Tax=Protofrankia symbiont of Coriaria ruscifolia TaxID=1306542 RepID=UPI0010411179|nr:GH25 family lysozyme [Protofrankia symbiont of Coriaria ruscifolia]